MQSAENGGTPYGREQAWQLLTEWTQSESLRKHAMAVEVCVTACGEAEADRLGLAGDERARFIELYSTTALLHDFDYERHPTPEEHPFVGGAVVGRDLEGLFLAVSKDRDFGGGGRRAAIGRFPGTLMGADQFAVFRDPFVAFRAQHVRFREEHLKTVRAEERQRVVERDLRRDLGRRRNDVCARR